MYENRTNGRYSTGETRVYSGRERYNRVRSLTLFSERLIFEGTLLIFVTRNEISRQSSDVPICNYVHTVNYTQRRKIIIKRRGELVPRETHPRLLRTKFRIDGLFAINTCEINVFNIRPNMGRVRLEIWRNRGRFGRQTDKVYGCRWINTVRKEKPR